MTFLACFSILLLRLASCRSSNVPGEPDNGMSAVIADSTERQQILNEYQQLSKFFCDFGSGDSINLCSWTLEPLVHPTIRWKAGQGTFSHWSGGPSKDHTTNSQIGGFAYFETSYKKPSKRHRSLSGIKTWILNRTLTTDAAMQVEQRLQPLYDRIDILNTKFEVINQRISIKLTNKLNLLQNQPLVNQAQNLYWQVAKDVAVPSKATLLSPIIPATRPQGVCFQFFFSIFGLSAEKLRLTIVEPSSGRKRLLWESKLESIEDWVKTEVSYAHPTEHRLILEAFAKNDTQSIEREYRGYIAIDDIKFVPQGFDDSCHGHCTFDGGLCGWRNEPDSDNFDWKLAKGSASLYTGPSQDFNSFTKDLPPGNFLFADSMHPLRFGDKALLVSPPFPPTSRTKGFCMKFAYHMYGEGIGNLSVLLRPHLSNQDILIWKVSGERGNSWQSAQVPLYSDEPFTLLFESTVGATPLGGIAVDAVHFYEEFCPTNPSFASMRLGDCTFEESLCNWNNLQVEDEFDWVRIPHTVSGGVSRRSSEVNLRQQPFRNDTKNFAYYLTLNGDMLRPDKEGLSARIQSPVFPANSFQCMTFHYLMYQNTSLRKALEPALGGLRIYLQEIEANGRPTTDHLIFRLNNHQSNKWRRARIPIQVLDPINRKITPPEKAYHLMIEGIWANARSGIIGVDDISFASGDCDMTPSYAEAKKSECTFDKTLCGWTPYNPPISAIDWISWEHITASSTSPSQIFLRDHTFNVPIGYVSFTSTGNRVKNQKAALLSPIMSLRDDELLLLRMKRQLHISSTKKSSVNNSSVSLTTKCMGFWFRSFPGSENLPSPKSLSIFQAVLLPKLDVYDAKSILLWKITDKQLSPQEWTFGQVDFPIELNYRLVFKSEASDGGFAIDDVSFYDGQCQTRPFTASVQPSEKHINFGGV